jgi:hypothetical protein
MLRIFLAIWLLVLPASWLFSATPSITRKVELRATVRRHVFSNTNWVYAVIPAHDGGYFVAAQRNNGCALLRLDADSNILWERPAPPCNSSFKMLELEDGSVLFVASTRLVKYALDGNVVTETTLEGGDYYDLVRHREGFLLGGRGHPPLNDMIAVQLVSTNLSFSWRRYHQGYPWPGNVVARSAGYVYGNGSGVVQIGTNGVVEWETKFRGANAAGGPGADWMLGFCSVREGGYLLWYQSQSLPGFDRTSQNFGYVDYWLVRIDAVGRKIWDRSYGSIAFDSPVVAMQTEDNGFIVVGESYDEGMSGNKGVDGAGIWILKLDSRGLKEAEYLVPDGVGGLFRNQSTFSVYGRPRGSVDSVFRVDLDILRRIVVSVQGSEDRAYNLDVSSDLATWTPLVMGFVGDLELREHLGASNKFYRVWEP